MMLSANVSEQILESAPPFEFLNRYMVDCGETFINSQVEVCNEEAEKCICISPHSFKVQTDDKHLTQALGHRNPTQ